MACRAGSDTAIGPLCRRCQAQIVHMRADSRARIARPVRDGSSGADQRHDALLQGFRNATFTPSEVTEAYLARIVFD